MDEIRIRRGLRKRVIDWGGIRSLAESGMTYTDVAKLYRVNRQSVMARALKERWLTQVNVDGIRKEGLRLAEKLRRDSGDLPDPIKIKAELWKERGEAVRERAYGIAMTALDAIADPTSDVAKHLVQDAGDVQKLVKVARDATGLEEAKEGPKLAVNIGFLSSARPEPIDV